MKRATCRCVVVWVAAPWAARGLQLPVSRHDALQVNLSAVLVADKPAPRAPASPLPAAGGPIPLTEELGQTFALCHPPTAAVPTGHGCVSSHNPNGSVLRMVLPFADKRSIAGDEVELCCVTQCQRSQGEALCAPYIPHSVEHQRQLHSAWRRCQAHICSSMSWPTTPLISAPGLETLNAQAQQTQLCVAWAGTACRRFLFLNPQPAKVHMFQPKNADCQVNGRTMPHEPGNKGQTQEHRH